MGEKAGQETGGRRCRSCSRSPGLGSARHQGPTRGGGGAEGTAYGDGTEFPLAGRGAGAGVAFTGRDVEDGVEDTAYGVAVGVVIAGAVVTGTAVGAGTGVAEIGVACTGAGAGAGTGDGAGVSGRGGGSCEGVLLPPGGGIGLSGASL